jgi:hypothetical protein
MPVTVPQSPQPDELARLGVGKPVSSAHGQRWANELAFLRAHALQAVAAVRLPRYTTGSTARFAYNRSPGCHILRVEVELWDSGTADRITVALSLAGATLLTGSVLDGATNIPCAGATRSDYTTYVGYLDVSGVTAGSTQLLAVTWASVTGGAGLYRVALHEVPLADTDPVGAPTTEVGVNGAWALPPNRLEQGATNLSYGWARLFGELDNARSTSRRQWQVATWENTANAWSTTSAAFAALTWTNLSGYDPTFTVRSRRLYAPTTKNNGTILVRYACSNSAAVGAVRVRVNNGAGTTNFDVTTNAGGSVGFQTATLANVGLDCDGTDQQVTISVQAKIDVGALRVSLIDWTEFEA